MNTQPPLGQHPGEQSAQLQDVVEDVKLKQGDDKFDHHHHGVLKINARSQQAVWKLVKTTGQPRFFAVVKIEHDFEVCRSKFNCPGPSHAPRPPFPAAAMAQLAKPKVVHKSGRAVPHEGEHTHAYKCTYTLHAGPNGDPIDVWDPDLEIDWP